MVDWSQDRGFPLLVVQCGGKSHRRLLALGAVEHEQLEMRALILIWRQLYVMLLLFGKVHAVSGSAGVLI